MAEYKSRARSMVVPSHSMRPGMFWPNCCSMVQPGPSRVACNLSRARFCNNVLATQNISAVRLRAVFVQAVSRGRTTGKPRPQPLTEQIITPIRPSTGSRSLVSLEELDSMNPSTGDQQHPAMKLQQQEQQQRKKNAKHDSRRGALVKLRVAPRR